MRLNADIPPMDRLFRPAETADIPAMETAGAVQETLDRRQRGQSSPHIEGPCHDMNNATPNQASEAPPLRLIRLSEVMNLTGLARPTIYRAVAAGRFPAAVKIGSATAWVAHEVESWIQSRITESRSGARTRGSASA
jgi:prophage regulatory protein